MFNSVTADGYFAGPNGEIDWRPVDDEVNARARALFSRADTFLLGRVTYALMAAYWPTPEALRDAPVTTRWVNNATKLALSRTVQCVDWENTSLAMGDLEDRVRRLKQQPGRDIVVLGSGSIVAASTRPGLIDEYDIIVAPILLGAGQSQFEGYPGRLRLKLIDSHALSNGAVVLTYQPVRA